MGNTKCGKGCKVVDIVDSRGTLLTIYAAVSNQSEVNLIEPALDHLPFEDVAPEHLVYRTADSEPCANGFRKSEESIRYETTLARYTGWIHLTCLLLTLKRF